MKKVRFESPSKMSENECHSPRPYLERQIQAKEPDICAEYPRLLPFSNDPIQRFETSNSCPYPLIQKTSLKSFEKDSSWSPSHDLELSMLDASSHEPRKPNFCKPILKPSEYRSAPAFNRINYPYQNLNSKTLSSIENQLDTPPNVLSKHHDFFIRKDDLEKIHLDLNPVENFGKLNIGKENNPVVKKAEIMTNTSNSTPEVQCKPTYSQQLGSYSDEQDHYNCHHCAKHNPKDVKSMPVCSSNLPIIRTNPMLLPMNVRPMHHQCPCMIPPQPSNCSHCNHHIQPANQHCNSNNNGPKLNGVDKKTWVVERFEQSKKTECMEVEKQANVAKEKREPTVSDLFKIIKLQNEQLQLLQEKVDKFISAAKVQNQPTNNYAEQLLQSIDNEHKISIGVMTSFEMVRTSTIINKEVVKTCENAQIQCNRSQISIKGVVSKSPVNLNFLDGITRADHSVPMVENNNVNEAEVETLCEEKTLNEQSLYNVQVDNATTPMMSPEQTLHLDVRDYSDSDSGSDDHSNVGWTYYNKVMTHVNGVLQDSDMPSSASAMCRNARQQCMQMQIDKTNVSVTKRVKFGDDPLGIHQPHIYAVPTDTSLKMNQLAAKYLNNGPPMAHRPTPKPASAPIDMSFATRNYMERHRLLQGTPQSSKTPPGEMPRFLDITALKQQPKLL